MAGDYSASPLAQVFEDVYETYKRQTGGSGPPRSLTPLERTAQTAASEAVTALERRMTWLATIGSTSAVCRAVRDRDGRGGCVSRAGYGGRGDAAGGGAGHREALITTAAGLFVAVPAVVAYNQFSGAHQGVCFGHR